MEDDERETTKVDVKVGLWKGFFWRAERWFSFLPFPTKKDDERLENKLLEEYEHKVT